MISSYTFFLFRDLIVCAKTVKIGALIYVFFLIVALLVSAPLFAQDCNGNNVDDVLEEDADTDGVINACDNCLLVSNADQRDSNNDGYGNACDADLNNDGAVNFADLGIIRGNFFTADSDSDLNGDGAVNFVDLGLLKQSFFNPPGPGLPELPSIPVTANFQKNAVAIEEGQQPTIVIEFDGFTTLTLNYQIIAETASELDYQDASSGTIQVNGSSVELPISIIDDSEIDPESELLRVILLPGDGYSLGQFSELTLTILDNDVRWYGVLQSGSSQIDVVIEITNSEQAGYSGRLINTDGFGSFPIGAWEAVVSMDQDNFSADVEAFPLSTSATLFNQPLLRQISLTASNIEEGQNNPDRYIVSEDLIRGEYSDYIYAERAEANYLNTIISGVFTLSKEPTRSSFWEPSLVSN